MPLRPARAACLKALFTSSLVVFFSSSAASSTTETSGVGTRSEMPSIFPFTSGITRLGALAAPVGNPPGALEHQVHAQLLPWQLLGLLDRRHLDGLAVDDRRVALCRDRSGEAAVRGVVLQEMRERFGIGDVVHRHKFQRLLL